VRRIAINSSVPETIDRHKRIEERKAPKPEFEQVVDGYAVIQDLSSYRRLSRRMPKRLERKQWIGLAH